MSDVVRCPFCKKYIDITFNPDTCVKCGGSLTSEDLRAATDEATTYISSPSGIINWLIVFGCIGFYLFTTGNPFRDLNFSSPANLLGQLFGKALIWAPATIVAYQFSRKEKYQNSWGGIFLVVWLLTILVGIMLVIILVGILSAVSHK